MLLVQCRFNNNSLLDTEQVLYINITNRKQKIDTFVIINVFLNWYFIVLRENVATLA